MSLAVKKKTWSLTWKPGVSVGDVGDTYSMFCFCVLIEWDMVIHPGNYHY